MIKCRIFFLVILCIISLVFGCNESAELIEPEDIIIYGTDPSAHTLYVGSDEGFHYFAWQNGKDGGLWKVSRKKVHLNHEFYKGKGSTIIVKDENGKILLPLFGNEYK